MVGIYNCTWSAAAALAYFTGGKLYDMLGAGAVFWIPAGIFLGELILTLWLSREAKVLSLGGARTALSANPETELRAEKAVRASMHPEPAAFRQSVSPETFLKLAALASPFAYVAVNTLFAVMPGLALKLGLSPTKVGLFCSMWLFGRLGAFITLWQWTGWHYRFRWMVAGFFLLIASFMFILLASKLWIVVAAQIFFGFAAGLMYYASLFYSMDEI